VARTGKIGKSAAGVKGPFPDVSGWTQWGRRKVRLGGQAKGKSASLWYLNRGKDAPFGFLQERDGIKRAASHFRKSGGKGEGLERYRRKFNR